MPLSAIPADQLLSFIHSTAVATWTVASDGYVVDVPQWAELAGLDAKEIEGDGWLTAVHPDDRARVAAAWKTAIAHGQTYNTDYRIRNVDRVYRWFNARAAPIRLPDGRIDRWVGMFLEIPGMLRFGDAASAGGGKPEVVMLDAATIRGARAMLNWSAGDLATHSGLSVSTIRRLETDDSAVQSRKASTDRLLQTFTRAGISFVGSDGSPCGVCLKKGDFDRNCCP